MPYEFRSEEELFKRVRPAIKTKLIELKRLGYKDVKELDVWTYLKENKWKKSNNLQLDELVNDVLNFNNLEFYKYLTGNNKVTREERYKAYEED